MSEKSTSEYGGDKNVNSDDVDNGVSDDYFSGTETDANEHSDVDTNQSTTDESDSGDTNEITPVTETLNNSSILINKEKNTTADLDNKHTKTPVGDDTSETTVSTQSNAGVVSKTNGPNSNTSPAKSQQSKQNNENVGSNDPNQTTSGQRWANYEEPNDENRYKGNVSESKTNIPHTGNSVGNVAGNDIVDKTYSFDSDSGQNTIPPETPTGNSIDNESKTELLQDDIDVVNPGNAENKTQNDGSNSNTSPVKSQQSKQNNENAWSENKRLNNGGSNKRLPKTVTKNTDKGDSQATQNQGKNGSSKEKTKNREKEQVSQLIDAWMKWNSAASHLRGLMKYTESFYPYGYHKYYHINNSEFLKFDQYYNVANELYVAYHDVFKLIGTAKKKKRKTVQFQDAKKEIPETVQFQDAKEKLEELKSVLLQQRSSPNDNQRQSNDGERLEIVKLSLFIYQLVLKKSPEICKQIQSKMNEIEGDYMLRVWALQEYERWGYKAMAGYLANQKCDKKRFDQYSSLSTNSLAMSYVKRDLHIKMDCDYSAQHQGHLFWPKLILPPVKSDQLNTKASDYQETEKKLEFLLIDLLCRSPFIGGEQKLRAVGCNPALMCVVQSWQSLLYKEFRTEDINREEVKWRVDKKYSSWLCTLMEEFKHPIHVFEQDVPNTKKKKTLEEQLINRVNTLRGLQKGEYKDALSYKGDDFSKLSDDDKTKHKNKDKSGWLYCTKNPYEKGKITDNTHLIGTPKVSMNVDADFKSITEQKLGNSYLIDDLEFGVLFQNDPLGEAAKARLELFLLYVDCVSSFDTEKIKKLVECTKTVDKTMNQWMNDKKEDTSDEKEDTSDEKEDTSVSEIYNGIFDTLGSLDKSSGSVQALYHDNLYRLLHWCDFPISVTHASKATATKEDKEEAWKQKQNSGSHHQSLVWTAFIQYMIPKWQDSIDKYHKPIEHDKNQKDNKHSNPKQNQKQSTDQQNKVADCGPWLAWWFGHRNLMTIPNSNDADVLASYVDSLVFRQKTLTDRPFESFFHGWKKEGSGIQKLAQTEYVIWSLLASYMTVVMSANHGKVLPTWEIRDQLIRDRNKMIWIKSDKDKNKAKKNQYQRIIKSYNLFNRKGKNKYIPGEVTLGEYLLFSQFDEGKPLSLDTGFQALVRDRVERKPITRNWNGAMIEPDKPEYLVPYVDFARGDGESFYEMIKSQAKKDAQVPYYNKGYLDIDTFALQRILDSTTIYNLMINRGLWTKQRTSFELHSKFWTSGKRWTNWFQDHSDSNEYYQVWLDNWKISPLLEDTLILWQALEKEHSDEVCRCPLHWGTKKKIDYVRNMDYYCFGVDSFNDCVTLGKCTAQIQTFRMSDSCVEPLTYIIRAYSIYQPPHLNTRPNKTILWSDRLREWNMHGNEEKKSDKHCIWISRLFRDVFRQPKLQPKIIQRDFENVILNNVPVARWWEDSELWSKNILNGDIEHTEPCPLHDKDNKENIDWKNEPLVYVTHFSVLKRDKSIYIKCHEFDQFDLKQNKQSVGCWVMHARCVYNIKKLLTKLCYQNLGYFEDKNDISQEYVTDDFSIPLLLDVPNHLRKWLVSFLKEENLQRMKRLFVKESDDDRVKEINVEDEKNALVYDKDRFYAINVLNMHFRHRERRLKQHFEQIFGTEERLNESAFTETGYLNAYISAGSIPDDVKWTLDRIKENYPDKEKLSLAEWQVLMECTTRVHFNGEKTHRSHDYNQKSLPYKVMRQSSDYTKSGEFPEDRWTLVNIHYFKKKGYKHLRHWCMKYDDTSYMKLIQSTTLNFPLKRVVKQYLMYVNQRKYSGELELQNQSFSDFVRNRDLKMAYHTTPFPSIQVSLLGFGVNHEIKPVKTAGVQCESSSENGVEYVTYTYSHREGGKSVVWKIPKYNNENFISGKKRDGKVTDEYHFNRDGHIGSHVVTETGDEIIPMFYGNIVESTEGKNKNEKTENTAGFVQKRVNDYEKKNNIGTK